MRISYVGPAGLFVPFAGLVSESAAVESYVLSDLKKGLPFDQIVHTFIDLDWEPSLAQLQHLRAKVTQLSNRIQLRRVDGSEDIDGDAP